MIIEDVYENEVPILIRMAKLWLQENGGMIRHILTYEKEGIYKNNKSAQDLLNGLEICKAIEHACKNAIKEEE